jgi:hypothetical protein
VSRRSFQRQNAIILEKDNALLGSLERDLAVLDCDVAREADVVKRTGALRIE